MSVNPVKEPENDFDFPPRAIDAKPSTSSPSSSITATHPTTSNISPVVVPNIQNQPDKFGQHQITQLTSNTADLANHVKNAAASPPNPLHLPTSHSDQLQELESRQRDLQEIEEKGMIPEDNYYFNVPIELKQADLSQDLRDELKAFVSEKKPNWKRK